MKLIRTFFITMKEAVLPLGAMHAAERRITASTILRNCSIVLLILPALVAAAVPEAELAREITPLSIRGINYYPRETPWGEMWTKTSDDVWARDMKLVASLGGNAIRTFVQFGSHIEKAGLMNRDGSLKPAAIVLQKAFSRWNKH